MKQGRTLAPAPPREGPQALSVETRVGKIDGRKARATGRVVQFNTRVAKYWLDMFENLRLAAEERAGAPVTRGYFFEILTAVYLKNEGQGLPVFGLPDRVLAGLDRIAEHTGLSREQAVEQAIAVYLQKLGLKNL
jgi:hypothetical protein